MIMDAKKLSALIREEKMKMLSAEPELVDTDSRPDMNPMDLENVKQQGRIESALDVEPKIDARDSAMDESEHDAGTAGMTTDQEGRMARLKAYLESLDI
jgi:hypothetical protein